MQMSARAVAQKRETEMRSCMLSSSVEIAANLHKTVFFRAVESWRALPIADFCTRAGERSFYSASFSCAAQLGTRFLFTSLALIGLFIPTQLGISSQLRATCFTFCEKKEIFGAALMNQNAAVCALADSNFNLVCYSYCFSSAISKRVINLV